MIAPIRWRNIQGTSPGQDYCPGDVLQWNGTRIYFTIRLFFTDLTPGTL
jgi:hypothetical protein